MSSMELFCDAYLMNNCCECILQYYISAMLYVKKNNKHSVQDVFHAQHVSDSQNFAKL